MKLNAYSRQVMLLGAVIFAPLLVWQLTIRDAVPQYNTYREMQREIITLEKTSDLKYTEQLPKHESLISNGDILEKIKHSCTVNNIAIIRYTPLLTASEKNWKAYSGELVLSGSYVSLLRLMHYMEHKLSACNLLSAGFLLYTEPRSRQRSLRLTLILRQIEKHH